MNEQEKEISLHYENDVFSAMISMFSTLNEESIDSMIELSEDKKSFKILLKQEEEIISFDFDYKPLEKKIFGWMKQGIEWLHLDESESKIFRLCSHAAYYFQTEKLEEIQLNRDKFIQFHKRLFR